MTVKAEPHKATKAVTAQQVYTVLSSTQSHYAMVPVVGLSRETIRKIRLGLAYTDVHPEMDRWQPLGSTSENCWNCQHHRSIMTRKEPQQLVINEAPSCMRARTARPIGAWCSLWQMVLSVLQGGG